MRTEKVDVLVIGAGPSGTVAASIINNAGFKVKVVERELFPRFVIGESLLPRCMEHIEHAGLLDAVKAMGFQQKFGAKFVKGDLLCDFNFSEQFTEGWTWTWQVPRADFDMALATEAQRKGVDIAFQNTVTGIEFNGPNSTTTVTDANGEAYTIEARFIVDSSGYGRVLPRLLNLDKPSNLPPRKTFFAHVKDVKRPDNIDGNRITIIDHIPGVWIWVIPFSNGNTSVGFVGDKSFFEKFEGTPEEKFRAMITGEKHIKERLENVELVFDPRTIEGWSVTTTKFFGDGFVLTGNATEFLDPIFSSGVTLATESGRTAADLVARQLNGETINWQKEYGEHTQQGVDVFRSYVTRWYSGTLQKIFFAPNVNTQNKNQICSVLAGYVWDTNNPFVKKHERILDTLAEVVRIETDNMSQNA
jgi:flavin-dependent dehydrogenase